MPHRRPPADPDAAFLASYDPAAFERPSVTVDVVLLTTGEDRLRVFLLRREAPPQADRWSLPGGFVHMKEGLDAAAARVLREKAGLERVFIEQLYTFGEPGRDPRTRVISVAYFALVEPARLEELQGRLAVVDGEVAVDERGRPIPLAFDHAAILAAAVVRLRGKLDHAPVGFQLLPRTFTLLQLQRVHEIVLGRALNKDSFRRRMLASGQLAPTGALQKDVEHRPAELFRFVHRSAV